MYSTVHTLPITAISTKSDHITHVLVVASLLIHVNSCTLASEHVTEQGTPINDVL